MEMNVCRLIGTNDCHAIVISFYLGSSKCMHGTCGHPKAYKWVQCSICEKWQHWCCASVLASNAKKIDFVFYCSEC